MMIPLSVFTAAPLLIRLTPYVVIGLLLLTAIWIVCRNLFTNSKRKHKDSNNICSNCHGCSISNCASRKNDDNKPKEK